MLKNEILRAKKHHFFCGLKIDEMKALQRFYGKNLKIDFYSQICNTSLLKITLGKVTNIIGHCEIEKYCSIKIL